MNIYALFPLIATIAFILLLFTTIGSRPWQARHRLFAVFLVAAMLWSLADYFFRSNFFPRYNFFLLQLILIIFTWMAVQFHCFTSSFFSPGQGRWLPFAYTSLAAVIVLVLLRYIPEGITVEGDKIYPHYGNGVIIIAVPLLTLVGRNMYVFRRKLRTLENPILYNQVVSLVIGLSVLSVSVLVSLLPWGREYPISHFGNMLNAFILSYATIRHQLVDIRSVLRRGLVWTILGTIGAASYGLLLVTLHNALRFELNLTATLAATAVAVIVAIIIYKLRGFFFVTMGKALQGSSFDYRQQLSSFADNIHSVFSLREQGGELLKLVTRAVGCKKACLMFLENGSDDFTAQLFEPGEKENPLSSLRLDGSSPIVEYLRRERKPLTGQNIAILPEFRGLWGQEKEEIRVNEIELFMPLISRDRLIGIMVLDKKGSGRYLLEDFLMLEEVASRVAVSMEKEYLREQLREREEELSVINRSSAIMTSSLDIQRIYDGFVQELKKIVDVSWAAIVLIEGDEMRFLALSSEIGSAWKAGERVPLKGSATEWLASHRQATVEPDLTLESRFSMGKYHISQGVRSIAYLPLIVKDAVIGSLIVASRFPNAYNQRRLNLLEQLAAQVAMPIENSRLYAQAEQEARLDGLTDLLNRRALDELIASEISRHSRYGGVFSLIILDLDSFKAFNDKHGHLAGDTLLRQIGSVMKKAIRNADQAFRYGGDEFAVLLPQTTIESALEVAERVRHRVTSEGKTDQVSVTASLGLASWPADGVSPNDIVAAADAALYNAKRSGGNRSCRASGAMLIPDDTAIASQIGEGSEALSAIYALAATVDLREQDTRQHSKKVNEYAVALAEALGLGPLEISRLSTCAFLHDIGKIGISDEILSKPGKLTDEEWEVVKAHPQLGAAIASHARQLAPCIPGILCHHERYDGSGYPKGLKREEIPLEARILAIADAFTAMTSERTYSNNLSLEQAMEEIMRGAGTQFDPDLAKVFQSIFKITPVTS